MKWKENYRSLSLFLRWRTILGAAATSWGFLSSRQPSWSWRSRGPPEGSLQQWPRRSRRSPREKTSSFREQLWQEDVSSQTAKAEHTTDHGGQGRPALTFFASIFKRRKHRPPRRIRSCRVQQWRRTEPDHELKQRILDRLVSLTGTIDTKGGYFYSSKLLKGGCFTWFC